VAAAIAERRPRQIVVVNANKLYLMARDARLRAAVNAADLVIPEWAVVWGARQLGLPPLGHVGGLTLAQAFMPYAAERGLRPYLLGAQREVVEALAHRLRADHPRLDIAGWHDGYLTSPEIEAAVIADIQRARPDMLFVAMGSPKQELWLQQHQAALGVPVSLGVGGSFDVLSGLKPDAPAWTRGRGLEWLYRLSLNPRAYARRYLVTNIWFVWQVWKARLTARRQHGQA
jgi:N-acetylglucosaminyldiphosphoundecaprenol N-acetyl-beta-D-mannosaminyltransferase